ncbi:MAG: hypothetical protein AAGB00_01825 [Planctomycetota bacterium]
MPEDLLLLARSDGIAVTLTPLSKAIVGGLFLLILGGVAWVVSYRKPDDDPKASTDR